MWSAAAISRTTYLRNAAALFPGCRAARLRRSVGRPGSSSVPPSMVFAPKPVEAVARGRGRRSGASISPCPTRITASAWRPSPPASTCSPRSRWRPRSAEGQSAGGRGAHVSAAWRSARHPTRFLGAAGRLARRLIDRGQPSAARSPAPRSCWAAAWSTGTPNPQFYYQPGGGPVLDMGAVLSHHAGQPAGAGTAGDGDWRRSARPSASSPLPDQAAGPRSRSAQLRPRWRCSSSRRAPSSLWV